MEINFAFKYIMCMCMYHTDYKIVLWGGIVELNFDEVRHIFDNILPLGQNNDHF